MKEAMARQDEHTLPSHKANPLLPPSVNLMQDSEEGELLKSLVVDELCSIFDPEIPVNIWELGLIYEVNLDAEHNASIKMTLTSPACPVAGSLPPEVERRVRAIKGINDVKLELVWDPPWTKDMMSEAAKLQLGFL